MARRVYLSDVIGTGTEGDPYRAALQGLLPNVTAVIPSHPVTGAPLFNWCLAVGAGTPAQHAAAANDGRVDMFPAALLTNLDDPISSLTANQRNAIRTALTRRLAATAEETDAALPIRRLLRKIGRFLDANFHESNQNVADVS